MKHRERTVSRLRIARALVQLAFLALFVGLAFTVARASFPKAPSSILLRLDPLAGIASVLASRSAHVLAAFWPAWVLLGLTLFSGRFFCGWLCPLGTCFDAVGACRPKGLRRRPGGKDVRAALAGPTKTRVRAKYLLLVVVLALSAAGVNLLFFSSPLAVADRGAYLVMIPAVPIFIIALLAAAFLYRPRVWCEELCPAGALMGLAGKLGQRLRLPGLLTVKKDVEACNSCGACYQQCDTGVTEPLIEEKSGPLYSSECTLCGDCVKACPTAALSLGPSGRAGEKTGAGTLTREKGSGFLVSRKDFITSVGLGAVLLAGYSVGFRDVKASTLRMPGAQDETRFLAMCERCGACMRTCPTKCIKPMGLDGGFQKLMTPAFDPSKGECLFDNCGQACQRVCPTGAIERVEPAVVKIGTAAVDRKRCKGYLGQFCLVCVERCRFQAVTADGLRPVVDPAKCHGCGSCELTCPVSPAAIRVYAVGDAPKQGTGGQQKRGRGQNS